MENTFTAYKDMSAYRTGRKESQVVQLWLNEYKDEIMTNVIYNVGKTSEMDKALYEMIHQGTPMTASVVADKIIQWLSSYVGHCFVKKAFLIEGMQTEPAEGNQVMEIWKNEYRDSILRSVIFREHTSEHIPVDVMDAIDKGSPETAEIVADTMIGWLNSYVGRCFVREAFNVNIPTLAPDGSE